MHEKRGVGSPPPYKPEELQELQRGQAQPLTVESLERPSLGPSDEGRASLVPDPGSRPGAVRLDGQNGENGQDEPEGPERESAEPAASPA